MQQLSFQLRNGSSVSSAIYDFICPSSGSAIDTSVIPSFFLSRRDTSSHASPSHKQSDARAGLAARLSSAQHLISSELRDLLNAVGGLMYDGGDSDTETESRDEFDEGYYDDYETQSEEDHQSQQSSQSAQGGSRARRDLSRSTGLINNINKYFGNSKVFFL